MQTTGRRIGSAPWARRASAMPCESSTGRVMTTRLPAKGDGRCSATGAVNLLQNCTCAGVNQHLGQLLAEFAGLVCGPGGALANVVGAIGGANHGVHGELVAFKTRPGAER